MHWFTFLAQEDLNLVGQAAQSTGIPLELILSSISLIMTVYFWYMRNNKERPRIEIFQISDFHSDIKRRATDNNTMTISFYQHTPGGILLANHSTLQNAAVNFSCYLQDGQKWIKGTWGYMGEDAPPWNIPPQSAIRVQIICSFEVPKDFQVSDDLKLKISFNCIRGKAFTKVMQFKMKDRDII